MSFTGLASAMRVKSGRWGTCSEYWALVHRLGWSGVREVGDPYTHGVGKLCASSMHS